jgi:hypothetical protein
MDCICGKRLVAVLPETIAALERAGEPSLKPSTRESCRPSVPPHRSVAAPGSGRR